MVLILLWCWDLTCRACFPSWVCERLSWLRNGICMFVDCLLALFPPGKLCIKNGIKGDRVCLD